MTPEQLARLSEETVRFIAAGQGALSRDGMRSLAVEVLVLRERTETWERRARRAVKGANARTADHVRGVLRGAVERQRVGAYRAVAMQAREAIRANLAYATVKDEAVLLSAFKALDAVLGGAK